MKTLDFLNSLHTDLELAYVYSDECNFEEFQERVYNYINHEEIIYYSVAIDFLKENDASLNESMELASDLGYETKNINSELLATLLHQQKLQQEWSEVCNEVEQHFQEK